MIQEEMKEKNSEDFYNQEFQYYLCKVNIRDKNGNNISDIHPTVGGRHDEKQKFITLAYDFEEVELKEVRKYDWKRFAVEAAKETIVGIANNPEIQAHIVEELTPTIELAISRKWREARHELWRTVTGQKHREEVQRAIDDAERAIAQIEIKKRGGFSVEEVDEMMVFKFNPAYIVEQIDFLKNDGTGVANEKEENLVEILVLAALLAERLNVENTREQGSMHLLHEAFNQLSNEEVVNVLNNITQTRIVLY